MNKVQIVPEERLLIHFSYSHLPEGPIQNTSMRFKDLAMLMCQTITPGPERTMALRKLLESKDAAVRAVVNPGS